jgi:tRNA(adenine34) deaminase
MFSDDDIFWMQRALQLAKESEEAGEVPVGAVITLNNEIIGEGRNMPISLSDPTAHAEIMALRQAGQKLNNYRLLNTTLYVTLEPCAMCFGALVHARVQRLVFGAADVKAGAVQSALQLGEAKHFNHRMMCEGGLLQESCGLLLTQFFQKKRKAPCCHASMLLTGI